MVEFQTLGIEDEGFLPHPPISQQLIDALGLSLPRRYEFKRQRRGRRLHAAKPARVTCILLRVTLSLNCGLICEWSNEL